MGHKKIILIVITGFLVLLVVFAYLTPFAGSLVANTRLEGYAKIVGIKIKKKSPPLPTVTSKETQIRVIQSSYCWGNLGCADYVGGKTMLEWIIPTVVTPEGDIKVLFNNKPEPNRLNILQFVDDKTTMQIQMKNGSFNAPKEKGIYYYGISAFFSKGDTSSVFVIEVR